MAIDAARTRLVQRPQRTLHVPGPDLGHTEP